MIKLNSARKLQAVLAGPVSATQPAATLGYSDKTAAAFDGDAELHDLNGATAVDICPAPAAGAIRQVDYLTIRNYDSAQVIVTVRVNEGGTLHNIFQATLQAGEVLGFTHAAGWYVATADGSRKSGAQDLSAYATYVAIAAGYQPLDADLTAIALLLTTAFGRGLLELADAAALRTVAGLGTLATQSANIADYALLAVPLSQFAVTTSAQLAGVISDETGTGALVFAGSPALTGVPSAPTAVDLTNTTQLATTQYVVTRVAQAVADLVASSPAALDTLNELATALGDDPAFAVTTATALGNRLRVDTAAQGLSGAQQGNALTNLGLSANAQSLVGAANYAAMKGLLTLDNVENKSSATIRGELTSGNVTAALTFTPENAANKDASGGYAGLTLLKINFKNALNTFTSFFTNVNTAARTYIFQDRNGTIADDTDLGTKQATLVSGTNIKTINSTSLLGSGDIVLSASPGGSTTQVQYNNAGAFAGAPGFTFDGVSKIALGVAGTSVGALALNNATSGSITLQPVTGALGTVTLSAPAVTDTLAVLGANSFSATQTMKTGATSSSPSISSPSGQPVILMATGGGNSVQLGSNNTSYLAVNSSFGATARSDGRYGWAADSTVTNNHDTALGRNAAGVVEVNNGTAGTLRDLKLRNLISSGGVVTLSTFTVSTLPSASTSGAGSVAYVTDATSTTYHSTVAGTGANKVQVMSDGTNWLIS